MTTSQEPISHALIIVKALGDELRNKRRGQGSAYDQIAVGRAALDDLFNLMDAAGEAIDALALSYDPEEVSDEWTKIRRQAQKLTSAVRGRPSPDDIASLEPYW